MPRQYPHSSSCLAARAIITLAFIKTDMTNSEPILDQFIEKKRRAAKRHRNLVAKNNKIKGGFHKTDKDYRRKYKYPVDFGV